MSLNMAPRLTRNNVPHMGGRDPKHLSNLHIGEAAKIGKLTDSANIVSREPRFPVALPSRLAQVKKLGTTTLNHISRVVLGRPDVQMSWIHTPRIIAMVKRLQVRWNRTVDHSKGISTCSNSSLLNREATVSMAIARPHPWPASVFPTGRIHVLQKSTIRFGSEGAGAPLRFIVAGLAAEPADVRMGRLDVEMLSTSFTNTIRGMLGAHSMVLSSGAMPRAVPAAPGLSRALIIPEKPYNGGETSEIGGLL